MRGSRPLTNDEIQAVLKHLEHPSKKRERAIFTLGIRTGLRITTILSLKISDVSQNGEVGTKIWVRRPTPQDPKAGYFVPLHHEAANALQAYLGSRKGSVGYLFKGRYPYTHMKRIGAWRRIHKVFRELNISAYQAELGSECMRKTFARLFYASTHDLLKTKYALRHASITSTFKFLSFNEVEVDRAILSL